jgi:hypothetical protein
MTWIQRGIPPAPWGGPNATGVSARGLRPQEVTWPIDRQGDDSAAGTTPSETAKKDTSGIVCRTLPTPQVASGANGDVHVCHDRKKSSA